MTVEAKPVAWITADAIESLQADGMCALAAGRKQSAVYSVPIYTNHVPAQGAVMVDELAQETRRVDGNHSLGAGALAEALMPFLTALHSPAHSGEREALERALAEFKSRYDTLVSRIVGPSGASAIETLDRFLKMFDAPYLANVVMTEEELEAALEAKQP